MVWTGTWYELALMVGGLIAIAVIVIRDNCRELRGVKNLITLRHKGLLLQTICRLKIIKPNDRLIFLLKLANRNERHDD
jgi:hypothetical protein